MLATSKKSPVQIEPVCYEIEDLWRLVDSFPRTEGVMSFEEMNEAKGRRQWQHPRLARAKLGRVKSHL